MAASEKSDMDCSPIGGPDCRCRSAVLRAFSGMISSGASPDDALAVALRVFHHHHPEIETGADALVERWVSVESLH